jgi:PAS domain-containing protein
MRDRSVQRTTIGSMRMSARTIMLSAQNSGSEGYTFHDGMILIDEKGRVECINETAAEVLEVNAAETVHAYFDHLASRARAYEQIRAEIEKLNKVDNQRRLEIRLRLLRRHFSRVPAVIRRGKLHILTFREDASSEDQADAFVELVDVLSLDLQQQLKSIRSAVQLLARYETNKREVGPIELEIARTMHLTNALMQLTKEALPSRDFSNTVETSSHTEVNSQAVAEFPGSSAERETDFEYGTASARSAKLRAVRRTLRKRLLDRGIDDYRLDGLVDHITETGCLALLKWAKRQAPDLLKTLMACFLVGLPPDYADPQPEK